MKFALIVLIVGFVASLLSACRPSRPGRPIIVNSAAHVVDTGDPSHAMCQSFTLSKRDVATFFRMATEVDGPVFHGRAIILPCRYEGMLTIHRVAWHFSVNAGGAGFLYRDDGVQKQFLCEQPCMMALSAAFGGGQEPGR